MSGLAAIAVIAVTFVVTFAVVWAANMAQRLNRLHIRTDAALIALQAALDRRAAVVAALDESAAPISHAAQAISLEYSTLQHRVEQERLISRTIAEFEGPTPAAIVDAEARLQLAHRFYNDAVADTRALRHRPLVRILRLGGTAPVPQFFEYWES